MVKRFFWVAIATVFLLFQLSVGSANAVELTTETLTIPLDGAGKTATLTDQEFAKVNTLTVINW